jgi:hypothetical protein
MDMVKSRILMNNQALERMTMAMIMGKSIIMSKKLIQKNPDYIINFKWSKKISEK